MKSASTEPALCKPDSDLKLGLPAHFYIDPEVFEQEKAFIFSKCWQLAGHVQQLPETGSCLTLDFLDQTLLFTREADQAVRGFVVEPDAHRPASNHVSAHKPIRVEPFLGFIMFNLDAEAADFAAEVPGLQDEIRSNIPELDRLVLDERDYGFGTDTLRCNWKVLVDNCVECYHCEPGHPAFADLIDLDTYRVQHHRVHTSHTAFCYNSNNAAYNYVPTDGPSRFAFWHVWPNLTFGKFPGDAHFSMFSADPVSVEHTRSRGIHLVPPGKESEEQVARRQYLSDVLWPEDKSLCESVQRGLHSHGYRQGPLVIPSGATGRTESVCHFFHRLNLAALQQ